MTNIKQNEFEIPCVYNDGKGPSKFKSKTIPLTGSPSRFLSGQQHAENFRLRTSDAHYESDWHTAGDPTLLVILQGQVDIELRNGETRRFNQGDMFIAEDYLNQDTDFSGLHGHRAKVVGNQTLHALHLKLSKLTS